jgi:hypothetical protein
MTTSSNVPLERIPNLWSADVKALRDVDIVSAEDLLQSVHKNGLNNLSASSGIPLEPLKEYLTTAETFISEEKTRRSATIMLALALSVVFLLSFSMLTVQAGLLPRSAAEAENAYADLHEMYSGAETVDQQGLLQEVTKWLNALEGEADSSRVNLLLLSSALHDRIAIELFQSVGDDPTSANFDSQFESYEANFTKARDEQALIGKIGIDDPRVAFARVNAAQAWASRAEKLGRIDLRKLPLDDQKRIDIEHDLRNAEVQAREETSLARNTRNFAPELFAQRIDTVRNKLDYQVPRRVAEGTDAIEAINALNENVRTIDTKMGAAESRMASMEGKMDTMQTSIADLQSPLADLIEEMDGQESLIKKEVGVEHTETRNLIGTVHTSLTTLLGNIDVDPIVAGSDCGLMDIETAKKAVKRQCNPRRGLRRTVTFNLSVIPSVDGVPRVVVEDGPTDPPLDCDLETVMADFTYDNEEHQCSWTFEAK